MILLGLLSVVAALAGTTYAWWWLFGEQTAAIETLRAQRSHTIHLPTDGTWVAQSFPLPDGGTDSACVWLENTRTTSAGILLQVHSDLADQPAQVLGRAVRTLDPNQRRCVEMPLPPLTRSSDRRYWLTVRLAGEQSPGDVNCAVADTPSLQSERLLIGTTERWGTLGMRVDAPESTRWARRWPTELYRAASPVRMAAVLGVGALVAATVLTLCAGGMATSPAAAWSVVTCVPVLLLLLHGTTHWDIRHAPPHYSGAGRALLEELRQAEMRTSIGALGAGFAVVTSDIRVPVDRALFALPESSVSWTIAVSEPTSLDTAAAVRQEAWTRPGDGAIFTVSVTADGRTETLWQRHIDPFSDPPLRRWTDVTVRLDRYVGREVTLTLSTNAGPMGNAVMDAAMWREPVLRRSVVR